MSCLGSTVELALEAWVLVSQPLEGNEIRTVTLPSVDGLLWMAMLGGLARAVLESSLWGRDRGELASDQLSYHPGPDPGLRVGPLQNLHHLKVVGTHDRASHAI